jgi:hypothetical protein
MITSVTPTAAQPQLTLHELQAALQAHILSGDVAIAAHLKAPPGGQPRAERLDIYHQGYRLRLLEVLQDHYERSVQYLGDVWFESEALAYIEANPSTSHSLRDYGQTWPDWLAQRHPADLDMADLARMEWALRSAFDAQDAPTLGLADLAGIPADAWDTVRLLPKPGTQVLHLATDAVALWQALAQSEAPAEPLSRPTCVLVWRQGWQPHFRSLGPAEASAMRALLQGQSFAQACSGLDGSPDAASTAGRWLQQWIQDGVIQGWQFELASHSQK